MKLNMNKARGFTLIEILVVIGIIAILATIVLIAINPARQFKQARDTQRTSNVNAILNAIGQYTADKKGDLPSDVDAGMDEVTQALCDDLVAEYLPALPTDPNSDSKGEAIEDSDGDGDCDAFGAGDVEYEVGTTTNNRVVVSSQAELDQDDDGDVDSNDKIEVTR